MMKVQSLKFKVQSLTAKYTLTCIVFCVVLNVCFSQDTTSLYTENNFKVIADPQISSLLYKYKEYNLKKEFNEGYRIQITYTDVRTDVYNSKAATYKEFPELASYVEYEQPYYKLRVGDFKTRLEATYYLQQVITLHPGAFIVRDKIKAK